MQEDISNILSRNLARKGLLKAANCARACGVARDIGKGDYEPISFCRGVLKVSVDSSAKAHLVKLQEKMIISKINEALKEEVVKKIIFKIG
jgi:hypothetical protein